MTSRRRMLVAALDVVDRTTNLASVGAKIVVVGGAAGFGLVSIGRQRGELPKSSGNGNVDAVHGSGSPGLCNRASESEYAQAVRKGARNVCLVAGSKNPDVRSRPVDCSVDRADRRRPPADGTACGAHSEDNHDKALDHRPRWWPPSPGKAAQQRRMPPEKRDGEMRWAL
jgi:hypothetical protein